GPTRPTAPLRTAGRLGPRPVQPGPRGAEGRRQEAESSRRKIGGRRHVAAPGSRGPRQMERWRYASLTFAGGPCKHLGIRARNNGLIILYSSAYDSVPDRLPGSCCSISPINSRLTRTGAIHTPRMDSRQVPSFSSGEREGKKGKRCNSVAGPPL